MRKPPYPFEHWSFRWIEPPEQDAPNAQSDRRDAAASIMHGFINAGVKLKTGRSQRMVDVFKFMTEGRAAGNPRYSECVDFAGGMLCILGVRDDNFVNRDDDDLDGVKDTKEKVDNESWWDVRGARDWRMAMNVTLLHQGSIQNGSFRKPDLNLDMGDVFFVDLGTGMDHVGVVANKPQEVSSGVYRCQTIEGGQVDEVGQCCLIYSTTIALQPGGKITMTRDGKKPRVLGGYIDVTAVPLSAPALVPPTFVGGYDVVE